MTPRQEKLVTVAAFPLPHTLRHGRRSILLSIVVTLLFLAGCSSGSNDFTGGGVPIGKAVIIGKVLRSESPNLPLANAQITVFAAPTQAAAQTLIAMTDRNGMFRVENIPTDGVSGTVTVLATPGDSAFLSQQITFPVVNQHTASLIVALPPASYQYTPGTTLKIAPVMARLDTGQSIQFTAQLHDANGDLLNLQPTILFDDDFGILNDNGTFTASTSGTGVVQATWYNGLQASSSVTVSNGLQTMPPSSPRSERTWSILP